MSWYRWQAENELRSDPDYEDLILWVISRWHDEVGSRPMENIHRRTLDDTWRQVMRWAGGDDRALIGPTHDEALRRQAKATEKIEQT